MGLCGLSVRENASAQWCSCCLPCLLPCMVILLMVNGIAESSVNFLRLPKRLQMSRYFTTFVPT